MYEEYLKVNRDTLYDKSSATLREEILGKILPNPPNCLLECIDFNNRWNTYP